MSRFRVGQEAVIRANDFYAPFDGLKVRVDQIKEDGFVTLTPLEPRPDGSGLLSFTFLESKLEPAEGPKDFLGKYICPGDTIVYPGRASSSMWLNKGKVISINKHTKDRYDWQTKTKVPHDYFTLTVEREGKRFVYDSVNKTGSYVPETKKVTLTVINRVVIVNG